MKSTAYFPLQTIGTVSPDYVGGICAWWYTPIQNIQSFPDVAPLTQQLPGPPTLKPGATWYGPVSVPDRERGWKQTRERAKPGLWQKQQITGIVDGIDIDAHINLNNLAEHQLCVVALLRAGHFFIILGNNETGMELDDETATGGSQFDSAGSKIALNWEGEALVLSSFNGVNSQPSNYGNNTNTVNVQTLEYTATGFEGSVLTLPALLSATILIFDRENEWFSIVSATPQHRQAQRNVNGDQFTFLVPLQSGESFKILYK